jgi:DNA polymerase III epsilon subunit-like protein
MPFPKDILLIDYETSGFNPDEGHEPLQLACVRLDRHTLDEKAAFETKIRPETPEKASPEALIVTGFDLESTEFTEAPAAAEVFESFESTLMYPRERDKPWFKFTLCAHNGQFDMQFHRLLLSRAGQDRDRHGYHILDTWAVAMFMAGCGYVRGKSFKLSSLAAQLGVGTQADVHDALEDVRLTADVLRKLHGAQADVRNVLNRALKGMRLMSNGDLDPTDPGVAIALAELEAVLVA